MRGGAARAAEGIKVSQGLGRPADDAQHAGPSSIRAAIDDFVPPANDPAEETGDGDFQDEAPAPKKRKVAKASTATRKANTKKEAAPKTSKRAKVQLRAERTLEMPKTVTTLS